METAELPVVVIGAGPQGLAAAAHLLERGQRVVVLEQGSSTAAAVREWGHVRLFSGWNEVIDAAARRLLHAHGWSEPQTGQPTGEEWVDLYLDPLAEVLGPEVVRHGHRVTGVARTGRDLLVSADRDGQPFSVYVTHDDGSEARMLARAVIDASGTWGMPNPVGAEGVPALGERRVGDVITHRIPGPAELDAYAGRHTIVVGSGASAFNAVATLASVVEREPGTQITWVLRRPMSATTFGGGETDQLPARGALGMYAQSLIDAGTVRALPGFRTSEAHQSGEQVTLVAEDGRTSAPADRVIALTGFRPDLSFISEVRLDLDPILQAPRLVADEVDPNLHSCGSVRATGAADLAQPESNFFIVGAKSYGRAPTFLAMTGYEQVRSVAAWLAGDHEAAARVDLELPATGVCGGTGLYEDVEDAQSTCCGVPGETEPSPPPTPSAMQPLAARTPGFARGMKDDTGACC